MRKRWIIAGILLAGLAAAYTGYWFWLARTFEQNLALWIDQQRALGYQISYAAGEARGYPLAPRIRFTDVVVESPADTAPWRFVAESVQLSLPPWRPMTLHVEASNPTKTSRLQWNADGRSFEVSIDGIEATIGLSDQPVLPTITVGVARLDLSEGARPILGVANLSGQTEPRQSSSPTGASLEFSLDALQMDLYVGAQSRYTEIYNPWLKGRLIGEIPSGPSREALATWSSQGGYLDLTNVAAHSDGFNVPPRFEGSASIALDPQLQPIVAGSVTVYDYIPAIDQAVAAGEMTPTQATATKLWLGARSEHDGGSVKATLPITIQDGFVSMGPVKLARVPRFEWQ